MAATKWKRHLPRRVLIVDTETTGLDPTQHAVIEVAGVVYDFAFKCVLCQYATLVQCAKPNDAAAVNHIPDDALVEATPSETAWHALDQMARGCDCVVAHNADFDRQWVPPIAARLLTLPWSCTQSGVDWPFQRKPGESLVTLALSHGLGVIDPHRALNDCMLITRLLMRAGELGCSAAVLIADGCEPRIEIQALVSFEEKDLAKEAGFHWEPTTKRWLRKMQLRKANALTFQWCEAT